MRFVPIALAATFTATATAQTPITVPPGQSPQELRLAAEYEAMGAGSSDFSLTVVGTQADSSTTPPTVTSIGLTLYYHSVIDTSGNLLVQLDLSQYTAGYKLFEVIADGKTLWTYRAVSRPTVQSPYLGTYTATPYTSVSYMLAGLRQVAPSSGPASYAARIVSELFSASAAGPQYRSWMPSPVPPYEVDPPTTYQNPITLLYANPATGTEGLTPPSQVTSPTTYVVYNGSPKRVFAFELVTDSTTNAEKLNRIYFTGADSVGGHPVTTFWTMTPGTDVSLANFTPYNGTQLAGWRFVVGSQAVHG